MDYYIFDRIAVKGKSVIARKNRIPDYKPTGLHQHNYIELSFVTFGEGFHMIDDYKYNVSKGDLVIIFPNQTHMLSANPGKQLDYYDIYIDQENLFDGIKNFEKKEDVFQLKMLESYAKEFEEIVPMVNMGDDNFGRIVEICRFLTGRLNEEPNDNVLLSTYALAILMEFFDQSLQLKRAGKLISIDRISHNILKYIDEHYTENLHLNDLAKLAYLSPSAFSRLFKSCYNMNYLDYIHKKKVEYAVLLLQAGGKSISEIIDAVGYKDRNQFYRVFRKVTGKTPTELKKEIKIEAQKCKNNIT